MPDFIHTTHSAVPPFPHVSLPAMFSMPNIPPLYPPLINQHTGSIATAGAAVPSSQVAGVTESTPTTAVPPVPASAMLNLTYPSASRSSDVQEILRALGL